MNELYNSIKSQVYECRQTKFRAQVMFCNMCVLSNKMLSYLMRKWHILLTEGNPAAPYYQPPLSAKTGPLFMFLD